MKINTDKAYLLGLLVGGGIIHDSTLQILLPYKKWGDLTINPQRAGKIAEDILLRLNPIFVTSYQMSVAYSFDTDWKIISNAISQALIDDLTTLGLPTSGEFRQNANLDILYPYLKNNDLKTSFITGLVDTVGSLAKSHRRFVEDYQVVSFEFKGNNFDLVKSVVSLLMDIGCTPDQVLWNHPNQHSGTCRYYKQWKKGFKIRVALDDYLLKGGFLFNSKQLSAIENKQLQFHQQHTTQAKSYRITGRTTLHIDEQSSFLPTNIRNGHFIHNLHFFAVLGIPLPQGFTFQSYTNEFEKYFCPFTCLTKDTFEKINAIIQGESYLKSTTYTPHSYNVQYLYDIFCADPHTLVFGKTSQDGFPINHILTGVAYILASSMSDTNLMKGKRISGSYLDVIKKYLNVTLTIALPNRGTCLYIYDLNETHGCLVGYVNNEFNKTLIRRLSSNKIQIQQPTFDACVVL